MKTPQQIVEHIKQQIQIAKNDMRYIAHEDSFSARKKDKRLVDPRIRILIYLNILDFINEQNEGE